MATQKFLFLLWLEELVSDLHCPIVAVSHMAHGQSKLYVFIFGDDSRAWLLLLSPSRDKSNTVDKL